MAVGVALLSGDAGAQTPAPVEAPTPTAPEPQAPSAAPNPFAPEAAPAAKAAPTSGATPEQVAEQWTARQAALARNDSAAASAALAAILELKETSGWPNFSTCGLALVRESQSLLGRGRLEEARAASEAAVILAPGRPETWAQRARVRWLARDSALAVKDVLKAVRILALDPVERSLRLGNLLLALTLALAAASVAFAAAALYRHVRPLSLQLLDILPGSATPTHALGLVLAIVATPLVLGLGLAWCLLFWLTVMARRYESHERAAALLVLTFLASSPLSLPLALEHLAFTSSRAHDVYAAATDLDARGAAARLLALPEPTKEEVLAIGLRERWSGNAAGAVSWIDKAVDQGAADASLHVVLGNIAFAQGDRQEAQNHYNDALRLAPRNVTALYNLSRVHFSMTEQQRAGELYREATQIDFDKVDQYAQQAKRRGADFVANPEIPTSLFFVPWVAGREVDDAATELLRAVTRGGPSALFGPLAALALVACGAAPLLRRGARGEASPEGKGKKSAALQRIRHEIQAHRHEVQLDRMRKVAALFGPGIGQLLGGRSLSGIAYVVLFTTSLLLALVALDVVSSPVPLADGPRWLAVGAPGVVALLVYVIALWSAQREAS